MLVSYAALEAVGIFIVLRTSAISQVKSVISEFSFFHSVSSNNFPFSVCDVKVKRKLLTA